ncbi:MAG: hypothetical protein HQK86_03345 [Nitrospinae bacterium]|nr:hypothetical protein [Nitrospinota bacterium]
MAPDSFEKKIRLRRAEEALKTAEALKEIEAKSLHEAQIRRQSAERARLEAEQEKAAIDNKLLDQKAAVLARDAARREKLNVSGTRVVSKSDITKAISNKKLASVFFQKNDFLENGDAAPAYVMDFVVKAGEVITEAESLNDPEFSAERYFAVFLDGYRRVPKLCMEALWLMLNVEAFNDRPTGWDSRKRIEMKMRALSASMGKGILSANHLIKSEIIKTRSGAGRLHEGPLFNELNNLFKEKGEMYDERLRLALKMSWVFAYAEMSKAGIPERYRLNMDAIDDVTLLLKIIIADTAMERHPFGPNKRRQTLSEMERVSEIVKNTGNGLMFRKPAVIKWLSTHGGLESIDLTYFPTEISIIEKESISEYAETLLDCVMAVFPEAEQVNAPVFAEVVKKFLTAQFSVKKKFTLKITPVSGAISLKVLDYDGQTLIRELNIPNRTSIQPSKPAVGAIPAPTVADRPVANQPPQTAPDRPSASATLTPLPSVKQPPSKRRLDLDIN